MSFSGTPLGQGRRLDHSSFLGKPTSNGNVPPPSYAYGAPALGSRSPPKPTSPTRGQDDDENDPALLRFARLKQRESVQNHRPGAPKIITSPPKPEKWAVKDTSVNIATAFTQAANGDMSTSYNHNNSWASSSRSTVPIPRSTSVEYEASAPQTVNRRLAPPPDKLGRGPTNPSRKPPSKSSSLRHVPDSEGEEERPSANGRGKSPFEHGLTFAKQALGAAAYYVRQRSREPDEPSTEQPSANGHTTNGNDSSYDYAAEEQAFQTQKRNAAAIHKRNRISVDNKAYKPTHSDEEESEYSDDGKTRRRRKAKKGGPAGGPLSTLPVVTAEKRKKKKGRGSNGNMLGPDDEDDRESEENTQTDIQSQMRTSVPRSNPPHSRPLPSRMSQEPSYQDMDDSMLSAEQGLHSIPEIEEDLLSVEPTTRQASQPRRAGSRARSRTPGPQQQPSSFSIGGLLGSIVHVVISIGLWLFSGVLSFLSMFTFLFGQVFGTTFDLILRRPAAWLRSVGSLFKYLVPALVIVAAWYALQNASLGSYMPSLSFPSSRPPVYQHPDIPPADIAELAERLLKIENAISGLSMDTERTKSKAEDGIKSYSNLMSRLGSLEGRLTTETRKVQDAEAKARDAVSKSIDSVKSEVEILQSQLIAQQKQQQGKDQRPSGDISDEEARAKLKALEDRVGGVEGGVKEALELGKKVAHAAPAAGAGVGSGAAWWNKLASGVGSKAGLQIKSSDGQDVTALISHLVDSAVAVASNKDGLSKPDFALSSAGARVVPHLTSPTLEVVPKGFGSSIASLFTGNAGSVGRSPVTALHHEEHSGHCWPFEGAEGQLGVALAYPAYVHEITIDHIAKEVAFDMRSAPREMEVWGMVEGKDNHERIKQWREERRARREAGEDVGPYVDLLGEEKGVGYPKTLSKRPEYIRLASFMYDINAERSVQTFEVDPEVKKMGVDFGIVALRVLSNWGHSYTCLYRIRVHGQRLDEVPAPWSPPTEGEAASS